MHLAISTTQLSLQVRSYDQATEATDMILKKVRMESSSRPFDPLSFNGFHLLD
jgi:hypothetical protein